MTIDSSTYWKSLRLGSGSSCPNVALFRLFGFGGVDIEGKRVLEIGFGANRGADLVECKARGAIAYGVDINDSYVGDFRNHHPDISVTTMNAGLDPYPFDTKFDLIYHRDVIYYLTDAQIEFHIRNSFDALSSGGFLIFQFIEKDLYLNRNHSQRTSYKFNLTELRNASSEKIFRGEENPIRLLNIDWLINVAVESGLNIKGSKTVLESYALDESFYRMDRYSMFQK
ncbi:class I SAM-dependent methyltransferase [Polynucleobacter sphagniphilus]|uniref:class I SAM-dependent methyltransferase n=1 Tax=Polynucleobacter sphagniphilus TaxID=1743169 RepID=UPI0024749D82|nr:class I SAM-dependent methyltransferase [Polynucleobacter sphagniphilus]MDH6525566.1 cyclopropane fatty-acyl-phospholipid synthase-like methyltransferase [Polynucleobacter sphagniphilus]